jgi:hypothetical protein
VVNDPSRFNRCDAAVVATQLMRPDDAIREQGILGGFAALETLDRSMQLQLYRRSGRAAEVTDRASLDPIVQCGRPTNCPEHGTGLAGAHRAHVACSC